MDGHCSSEVSVRTTSQTCMSLHWQEKLVSGSYDSLEPRLLLVDPLHCTSSLCSSYSVRSCFFMLVSVASLCQDVLPSGNSPDARLGRHLKRYCFVVHLCVFCMRPSASSRPFKPNTVSASVVKSPCGTCVRSCVFHIQDQVQGAGPMFPLRCVTCCHLSFDHVTTVRLCRCCLPPLARRRPFFAHIA